MVSDHPTSKRITARWKEGYVKVVCPRRLSKKQIREAVDQMAPKLKKVEQPAMKIADIVLPDWRLNVRRQSIEPHKAIVEGSLPEMTLLIGSAINLDDADGAMLFNRLALAAGKRVAPPLLLPRARQIARELGVGPKEWTISHGRKVLGHCSADKKIALSYICVFLPPELRDYIICHELAHLRHMDHSPKFHALCDVYCRRREKELIRKLRHYQWPIRK